MTITAGDPSLFPAGHCITITNSGWQSVEITTPYKKDIDDIAIRISAIEKRLAILRPNWELQARFPALLEAYEHYQTIEKLVNDQPLK